MTALDETELDVVAESPLARSRRTTELTLLVMAALITGAAYTITALGTNAEIPPGIVVFVAILLESMWRDDTDPLLFDVRTVRFLEPDK